MYHDVCCQVVLGFNHPVKCCKQKLHLVFKAEVSVLFCVILSKGNVICIQCTVKNHNSDWGNFSYQVKNWRILVKRLKSIFGPELKVKPVRNEGGREDGNCSDSEYAWNCGDVLYVFEFCRHLGLNLLPFPLIVAQLLGDGLLIKGRRQN